MLDSNSLGSIPPEGVEVPPDRAEGLSLEFVQSYICGFELEGSFTGSVMSVSQKVL